MIQSASTIYQTVILNHNRSPKGYGEVLLATHRADGFNPICGDRVTIAAIIEKEKFVNLGFTAQSCALCRASASVMVEALAESHLSQAKEFLAQFENMIRGKVPPMTGDAGAFQAIKDFPARAKCVLLPWRTLAEAVKDESKLIGGNTSTSPRNNCSAIVSTEMGE
jgi:nitrogen fixation NifU-like protein